MWATRQLFKSPGAAMCKDYAHARLITLSRPDALNTMTLAMLRDLYRIYIKEPHTDADAVYVVRGEGTRAFCAGGDISALGDLDGLAYRDEFFNREYELDMLIATMARPQVALWQGQALGSGVGFSLHGRYRVACETTRVALPETQIGGMPLMGGMYALGRLRMPALGAYLAITGDALRGADALHAGLATHYVPSADMAALQERLLAVSGPAEVAPLLDEAQSKGGASLPAFTLSHNLPVIDAAFTITPDTTVQGIMSTLRKDGSPFALATLATMERNSPTAMVGTLESLRQQRDQLGPKDVAAALMADLGVAHGAKLFTRDFAIGTTALLKDKSKARPPWKPSTVEEVDALAIRAALQRLLDTHKGATADAMKGKGDRFP